MNDNQVLCVMAAILYAGGLRAQGGILTDELSCAVKARELMNAATMGKPKGTSSAR